MADNSFILFTLGPVQGFIRAARTVRDLWSGSYLLSYLTYRAIKSVTDSVGPDAIVFPSVKDLPLFKWKPGTKSPPSVLEPCIPNRFLAEVPDEKQPGILAERSKLECQAVWSEIAEDVRGFLYDQLPHDSLRSGESELWKQQIGSFFEIYTAVLPQKEYLPERIRQLLGVSSDNVWSDRHQIAQKLLAAAKNRRHFPAYSPKFQDGMVPQKDSLLGTFEHVGPGDRRRANDFWKKAAELKKDGGWHAAGTKVTPRERLSAISLVKRFAWAHHFSKLFQINSQQLRYDDTATIAASKWLADGMKLAPDAIRRQHGTWSGQWLHWPAQTPARDDDDDMIPDEIWDIIKLKKMKQANPPTYYGVFVFDGDRMGDRFNGAADSHAYRQISGVLSHFASREVAKIVEGEHHGQLIYAGGDDALCLLPTQTALACAMKIHDSFETSWKSRLPGQEIATISGGIVIAHFKDDLRFVMNQARLSESRAKESGRNALQLTVCRRSGEHTSALVPWTFLPTLMRWVVGFLNGASDRWAYKLRGDLPVIGTDVIMFKLELGRQLCRAETVTSDQFQASELKADFDKYVEAMKDRRANANEFDQIENFVGLIQTASFLARGRDA